MSLFYCVLLIEKEICCDCCYATYNAVWLMLLLRFNQMLYYGSESVIPL